MIRLLRVGLVCVAALGCGGIIDGGGNGSDGGSNGRADGYAGADAALCTLSTDCGTRCVQGCVANSCPGDGTCILFFPRGSYNNRRPPCQVSSCIATCETRSDCGDGYECVSPRSAPWSGVATILDDDQAELVCLPGLCGSP
jgi:hypothetical protein